MNYLRGSQGSQVPHIIKTEAVTVNIDLGAGQQALVEIVYQFLVLLAQQLVFDLFSRLVEWHRLRATLKFEDVESVIRPHHPADRTDFKRGDGLFEHLREA